MALRLDARYIQRFLKLAQIFDTTVPRLVRSRSSKVIQASRQLEMKLGRVPTREEIASHLGVSPDEFEKTLKDSSAVTQVSLSR